MAVNGGAAIFSGLNALLILILVAAVAALVWWLVRLFRFSGKGADCGCGCGNRSYFSGVSSRRAAADWVEGRLLLQNMHCANCSRSVEGALLRIEGVRSARAEFKSGRVTFLYDGRELTLVAIKQRLGEIGFSVVEE